MNAEKISGETTSEFPEKEFAELMNKVFYHSGNLTIIAPIGNEKIIIDAILQEVASNKTILSQIGRIFRGEKKRPELSIELIDLKMLADNDDYANDLRTKLLIEIATKFSKNLPIQDLLPKDVSYDNTLPVVIGLLKNLKLYKKVDKQLLMLRNLNFLDEQDQTLILALLGGQLTGPNTLDAFVFKFDEMSTLSYNNLVMKNNRKQALAAHHHRSTL